MKKAFNSIKFHIFLLITLLVFFGYQYYMDPTRTPILVIMICCGVLAIIDIIVLFKYNEND